jgi:hypothetical protein
MKRFLLVLAMVSVVMANVAARGQESFRLKVKSTACGTGS